MSETENRESSSASEGEAIAHCPIPSDTAAKSAPASSAPRISESSFEAAHADLPPLSTLGGNGDATVVASESTAPAGNGPRRGRGRGSPAGTFGASGQPAKTAFGVVENPADLTENLSGKHVTGYGDQQPREERPRREERKPREAAPSAAPTEASAPAEAVSETGPKEFVPPVSEGTFKAELNPETERKAREERRQQRDDRPRGDRPQAQGGEFRGDRRQAEGRFQGDERRQGERRDGGEFRGDRQPRGEHREGGERRNDRDNNRGDRTRPGRLTIEAPKMPVQEPTSAFGKFRRWVAEMIWGVPATEEVGFTAVRGAHTPHSKDWQFNRGGERHNGHNGNRRDGDNRPRGDFRHGNAQGGDRNPNRDSRHRPHARGGNHHDRHGRDGNPRG